MVRVLLSIVMPSSSLMLSFSSMTVVVVVIVGVVVVGVVVCGTTIPGNRIYGNLDIVLL